MTGRNPKAGMTLLELLLALAVMAMLLVTALSLLGTGTRVWQRTSANTANIDHFVTQARVRDMLQEMTLPRPGVPADYLFTGTSEGFTWKIPLAHIIDEVIEDIIEVSVTITENDQSQSITVSERNLKTGEETNPVTLATDLTDVQLSYFGAGDWQPAWQNPEELPDLVRITASDASGTPILWFTVQPAKTAIHGRISRSSPLPPG